MAQVKQDMIRLIETHEEFQLLVDKSSKDELIQCAKLLAMYLSLYKLRFGEISANSYIDLLSCSENEEELTSIIEGGHEEASAMLRIIKEDQSKNMSIENTPPSNYLN